MGKHCEDLMKWPQMVAFLNSPEIPSPFGVYPSSAFAIALRANSELG
jgi:hypothetical protein